MGKMLYSRELQVRSLEPDEKNAATRLHGHACPHVQRKRCEIKVEAAACPPRADPRPLLLWQTAKGCAFRRSIEADPDLAEIEPLLPFLVGDEVLFAQALVREARVVLIDKDRFHHAGGTQNFDVLPGGGVGQAQTFGERLDVFAAAAAQDIDDLPARDRTEDRTEVGHAASVDAATG